MIQNAPLLIKTPRLNLRQFQSEDTRSIFSLLEDSDVRRGTSHWPDDLEIAHVRNWLRGIGQQKAAGASLVYAVCDHRLRLMGEVSLVEIYGSTANFTYWLGRSYWGRGYATEAGEALLTLARSLGFKELTALHLQTNEASGRVLHKLEFDFVEMQERSQRGVMQPFKSYRLDLQSRSDTTDFVLA